MAELAELAELAEFLPAYNLLKRTARYRGCHTNNTGFALHPFCVVKKACAISPDIRVRAVQAHNRALAVDDTYINREDYNREQHETLIIAVNDAYEEVRCLVSMNAVTKEIPRWMSIIINQRWK